MRKDWKLDLCGCRQQLRAQHGAPGMQPPPQQGMFPQQQGGPAMYTGMQQGMGHTFCTKQCCGKGWGTYTKYSAAEVY
jgi:hypothetical protein